MFEGTIGSGVMSDMAIDDIVLQDCSGIKHDWTHNYLSTNILIKEKSGKKSYFKTNVWPHLKKWEKVPLNGFLLPKK